MQQLNGHHKSFIDATSQIKDHSRDLLHSHLELLEEELSLQQSSLTRGIINTLAASLCGMLACLLGSIALVELLQSTSTNLTATQAFATVAFFWFIAAIIFSFMMNAVISKFSLFPRATINSFAKSLRCLTK
ncbi:MAG: phage holin family protein [bacterium]|nr:phage holin family protein [bacterium]